ncbi:MAG: hypothetical protein HYU79_07530 [Nitrosomonadales bacterium]|nr:hypothetical protein [Nitrosomonadales bacterium]
MKSKKSGGRILNHSTASSQQIVASMNIWQPVGLKGNRLQIRLTGAYFTALLVNRTTIDLQNRQNLPSPSRIFASIPQTRQAARRIASR